MSIVFFPVKEKVYEMALNTLIFLQLTSSNKNGQNFLKTGPVLTIPTSLQTWSSLGGSLSSPVLMSPLRVRKATIGSRISEHFILTKPLTTSLCVQI